jgi:hypothetical protein
MMTKEQAISIFGSQPALARALGLTRQAVWMWPAVLSHTQANRVIAAAAQSAAEQARKVQELIDTHQCTQ